MTDAHDTPTEATDPDTTESTADETADETELAVYDLDGDGEISVIEAERANLGIVDARLEQIAAEGGIGGAIAGAVHKVVDKLDND